jgi:hypothetical protein
VAIKEREQGLLKLVEPTAPKRAMRLLTPVKVRAADKYLGFCRLVRKTRTAKP